MKSPNQRPGYIEQFNLVIQKDLGGNVVTAGYIGQLGRHLRTESDWNRPDPPGPNGATPAYIYAKQLPAVTSITELGSNSNSSYHAMQLSLVRRYKQSLTLSTNYTYARGINEMVNGSGSTNPFGLLPRNRRYDRGNSDLDIRHRWALTLNYELPFGRNLAGTKGALLKGWQINSIAFWQSGLPFTVTSPSPMINLPGVTSDRPDVVPSASLNVDNPSISKWFNTGAFRAQTKGTAGNEGRNQLYGPPNRRVDFSLFKDFPVKEGKRLQFRAECYNISNTANFATPNGSMGSAAFGIISSTVGMPRQFQFALKFVF